jgi:large subunit ribosomal protein L18
MNAKIKRRERIKAHIRHKVSGVAEKPRMTVFRSNAQIYVQLIDDVNGKTLASASSLGLKDKAAKKEQAAKVGTLVAQDAQEAGIK